MKNGIKTLIALIIVACSMFISFNFTPPSELQECNFEDFSASYISLMSNNYTDNEKLCQYPLRKSPIRDIVCA